MDKYDYGIFIFQPDDKLDTRDVNYNTIRDNVIFELGLYFGRLGRNKAFYLIPRNDPKLHIPTDLRGVTAGTYDLERMQNEGGDLRPIVGPFCSQIKQIIKDQGYKKIDLGIKKAELFNNFTEAFESLIRLE